MFMKYMNKRVPSTRENNGSMPESIDCATSCWYVSWVFNEGGSLEYLSWLTSPCNWSPPDAVYDVPVCKLANVLAHTKVIDQGLSCMWWSFLGVPISEGYGAPLAVRWTKTAHKNAGNENMVLPRPHLYGHGVYMNHSVGDEKCLKNRRLPCITKYICYGCSSEYTIAQWLSVYSEPFSLPKPHSTSCIPRLMISGSHWACNNRHVLRLWLHGSALLGRNQDLSDDIGANVFAISD